MTAEERANALVMEWALPDDLGDAIAAAIRAAEDEALERAAAWFEDDDEAGTASVIRSFKSGVTR